MTPQSAVRISCMLDRYALPQAHAVFRERKASILSVQNSRMVSMRSQRGLFGLPTRSGLEERGCEILRAIVQPSDEKGLMEEIALRSKLSASGRGSLFSENIQLYAENPLDLALNPLPLKQNDPTKDIGQNPNEGGLRLSPSLCGVLSVVQRGQGNLLSRSILEMGFSVPTLSYGEGMGLRSKLGLLRVTIPAGKEIILFLVDKEDAQEALVLASETIGLELPGRGFIYLFPVRRGFADTRIHQGDDRYHVASMEQVIAAIDQLSGGSLWRKRSAQDRPPSRGRGQNSKPQNNSNLPSDVKDKGLVCLSLSCADGLANDYLEMAMILGARGATLSQIQGLSYRDSSLGQRQARESSDLVLPEAKALDIIEAIGATGFFTAEIGGLAEISRVSGSVAYEPKRAS